VADLTRQGFLADARVYAPPVLADLSAVRTRAGDYAADQAADAMDRPTVTGNAVEHYQRLAPNCPAIAFTCNTKHAASVAAQFQAAGIRAATLLGDTKPEERDRLVAGLADGSVRVLVTVDVVSEGFDCPSASVAILLRPTKSLGLYLQQVGRVLRPKADGSKALILDHVGNVMRHGFPDDHREWTLADGVKRGPRGETAPSVRTCPKCYAAFKPAPICPVCGANCAPPPKPAMQQIDGELQELRRGQLHTARRAQARARTLPDLLALAKERGYSPGWAYKVYASRGKR
jgi:superfamily II DNA or RNA helicase